MAVAVAVVVAAVVAVVDINQRNRVFTESVDITKYCRKKPGF